MARNEEKHAGRLNRLWLQKLDEENLKKNPPRPGLGSLHTAADVKQWLPSIKRDIDFYLKQSQVLCYPESQIEDFSSKIESLTKEYKAYVRKLRELDPEIRAVPWTDRAYQKRKGSTDRTSEMTKTVRADGQTDVRDPAPPASFTPIHASVLDQEDTFKATYGYEQESAPVILNSNPDLEDRPLQFRGQTSSSCGCGEDTLDSPEEGLQGFQLRPGVKCTYPGNTSAVTQSLSIESETCRTCVDTDRPKPDDCHGDSHVRQSQEDHMACKRLSEDMGDRNIGLSLVSSIKDCMPGHRTSCSSKEGTEPGDNGFSLCGKPLNNNMVNQHHSASAVGSVPEANSIRKTDHLSLNLPYSDSSSEEDDT